MGGTPQKHTQRTRDTAYHYYVMEGHDVPTISRLTGVPTRTLYKWVAENDHAWDVDRERYAATDQDLIGSLKKLRATLAQTINDSPDMELKLAVVGQLSEINKQIDRLDKKTDRLPVVLDVIDSLCRYMRREAKGGYKPEIARLVHAWAEAERARYREA